MNYDEIYIKYLGIQNLKIIFFVSLITYIIIGSKYKKALFDKISVVIPTYNRGHLILKSIGSVLNQTYKNIEVLLIDDGSTDNTEHIIKNLEDKRIKYIKLNHNLGGSNARNIGIRLASGKYISFQDSDDYYHYDKLEKQYKNILKKKSDFDFCKVNLFFNKTYKVIFPFPKQEYNILRNNISNELCNGNFISTQAILVKRNAIKRYLFDINFPRLQDYDLVLRMVPKMKVSYTSEILVDLYREKDSIGNSPKKYNESLNLILSKKYNIKCNLENFYKQFKKNQK